MAPSTKSRLGRKSTIYDRYGVVNAIQDRPTPLAMRSMFKRLHDGSLGIGNATGIALSAYSYETFPTPNP